MTTTDPFDQQSQQLDANKASMLAAISQYGSQAHQAMQAAQDQLAAQKTAAISAALADARQRNAPQAELDQVSSTISSPYDRQLSNISQSDASRQASFAQQGSAAGNYYGQVQAALPALRNELAMKVATMQASAARQQQAQQLALARAQASAAAASARTSAAAAKASQPPGASKILSDQFGGQQGFLDYVAGVVPQAQDAAQQDYNTTQSELQQLGGHGNMAAEAERNTNQYTSPEPVDIADRIGTSAGLPAGLGSGLYSAYLTTQGNKAANQAASPTGLRTSDPYAAAVTDLINGANSQVPTATIAQKLTEVYGPDLARQVMSDYSRLLPGAKSTTTTTAPAKAS